MAATAGRQPGRTAAVVDESHLGQKPKLGEYVSLTYISLFRSLKYYMSVCSSFLCISMSLFLLYFLFFSVCSVAFVALFVYYLKTPKYFIFVCFFFLIIKKTKNIFLLFLVRSFSPSFQVAFPHSKTTKIFHF